YAAPLPRGEFTREGGFETRPYIRWCVHRNLRPTPFPSWEGCRPQAAGWFPAPCAAQPPSYPPKPPSLEGGCRLFRGGVPPQRRGVSPVSDI
ncbi:MAG: hypothetical protein LBM98_00585, partial [Oscillospiraceae bacterium]|nr:hypothetical protein [Oscillospiraceae bacterium]